MYQKILICDNTIYSRAMLKNLINELGEYIIVEAENRTQLLNKLNEYKKENKSFDLLFLGLEMKNEDSFSILREVREIESLLEVALCGGISLTDENIAEGLNLGVKKFLPKPYKSENIAMILNTDEVN